MVEQSIQDFTTYCNLPISDYSTFIRKSKVPVRFWKYIIEPLSKRDWHAAIVAFSFCLRAVNFENGGAVLLFPRLLGREHLQIFRKKVPKLSVGCVVICEDISYYPFKSSWQMAGYRWKNFIQHLINRVFLTAISWEKIAHPV